MKNKRKRNNMTSGIYKRTIGDNVGLNRGKTWKVKDTSKMVANKTSFQKNHKINVGRTDEKSPSWKGGLVESKRKRIEKVIQEQEELANRLKPEQCEICGVPEKDLKQKLCFDHCHNTGEFRGWICVRCNFMIGYAKDKVKILQSAIKYLEKNEK